MTCLCGNTRSELAVVVVGSESSSRSCCCCGSIERGVNRNDNTIRMCTLSESFAKMSIAKW